jgi:ABC-type amino acid transport substrate-binding protein
VLHTDHTGPALVKVFTEPLGGFLGRITPASGVSLRQAGWYTVVCLFLVAPVLGANGTKPAATAPPVRRVIRVGGTIDAYPYSYLDEQGQPTGFAVDLLNAVARVMDLSIEREMATGLEINRRFLAGEFDVNQQFSVTPDRLAIAQFSVPYLIVNGTIFARRGDDRFESVEDLRKLHA